MPLRTWAAGASQLLTMVQDLYTPEVEFVFGPQEPTQAAEERACAAMGDRSGGTCPYGFGVRPCPLEVRCQRKRERERVLSRVRDLVGGFVRQVALQLFNHGRPGSHGSEEV